MREELPTVEDLPEVVSKLRSEMESLRKEVPDEEKTISYRSETEGFVQPVNLAIAHCQIGI